MAKEAKLALTKAVTVFISYLLAHVPAHTNSRSVHYDHILEALQITGFGQFQDEVYKRVQSNALSTKTFDLNFLIEQCTRLGCANGLNRGQPMRRPTSPPKLIRTTVGWRMNPRRIISWNRPQPCPSLSCTSPSGRICSARNPPMKPEQKQTQILNLWKRRQLHPSPIIIIPLPRRHHHRLIGRGRRRHHQQCHRPRPLCQNNKVLRSKIISASRV